MNACDVDAYRLTIETQFAPIDNRLTIGAQDDILPHKKG
jgi:hypothetical protein